MSPIRHSLLMLGLALLAIDPACLRPYVSLSPSSLSFAPQLVSPGAAPSVAQSVTVTAHSGTVTINAINSSGGFSQTNDCPNSLAAGATCTIQVSSSLNFVGAVTGAITLSASAGPYIISLSAVGLSPVGFNPASLDFGSVGVNNSPSAQTVTLTNNQNTSLGITAIGVSGDYSQTNNCPPSLAAGQSCQISVGFQPTTSGTIPGALSVVTDASPGTQPVALTGKGSGSVSSNIAFSTPTFAFGNQEAGTSSAQKSVTVTNQGHSSVTIQSVSVSSGYASTDNCAGKMLLPGDTCSINVGFQPSADLAPMDYPGAVTVVDSDSTSPQVVGLTGTGAPPISSSPSTIDFGDILHGSTSASQTVTFTNNDAADEGLGITPSGHFNLSNNTCGSTLATGASCKSDVSFSSGTFAPPLGPVSGALTVAPSSGGFLSPSVTNLKACVTGILVSPTHFDFGAVPQGATSAETLTIDSPGGLSFNVSNVAVTGQNPGDFTLSNNTCNSGATATCTVDVTYAPQSSGLRSGVVAVADDDPCSPHQQILAGGSSAGPFTAYAQVSDLTGGGTVTSNPAGIDCDTSGTSCSASFTSGTSVVLTASGSTSQPGSHLSGWGGACSGTSTCVLTMNSDKQVTATFAPDPQFTVTIGGTGNGTVSSNPAGIDCEVPVTLTTNCVETFPLGVPVTLTATPASGSSFAGWSGGGCSGTGTCTFVSSSDQTITATFNSMSPPDFSLTASALSPSTVTAGQSATGTVTVNPSGGFNNTVTFGCSVQPSPSHAPTCAVTPSGSGASVTVMTSAPSPVGEASEPASWSYALWIPVIGLVALSVRRYKSVGGVLLLRIVLLLGITFQAACGGGNQIKKPTGGTPPGSYATTVTGTSGGLQHTTSFALTVQ